MTKLTDHETDVLSRLAQGYNQKETAKQMKLTPPAIHAVVEQIRAKQGGLDRAIKWYLDGDWAGQAVDELPDDDEPSGPVRRCSTCDLTEPHECLPAAAKELRGPGNPNYRLFSLNDEASRGRDVKRLGKGHG